MMQKWKSKTALVLATVIKSILTSVRGLQSLPGSSFACTIKRFWENFEVF